MTALSEVYAALAAEHRGELVETDDGVRWECECGEGFFEGRPRAVTAARTRHLVAVFDRHFGEKP